jgi:hypothetical protein
MLHSKGSGEHARHRTPSPDEMFHDLAHREWSPIRSPIIIRFVTRRSPIALHSRDGFA